MLLKRVTLFFFFFCLSIPFLYNQSIIPYVQYQKSGYELARALAVCSAGGRFDRASKLLSEPYWQQNPQDRNLLQMLLLWNVYGRERAIAFDDSLRKSGTACYNELYTKTWLAFYSNSNEDYMQYMPQLQAQQPGNRLATRLAASVILSYRTFKQKNNSGLSDKDFIGEVLRGNLNSEDRVFYLLAYCSTLGYGSNATKHADSLICALWRTSPDQLQRESIKYYTGTSESPECKQVFEEIDREDKATAPFTPAREIIELLRTSMAAQKHQSQAGAELEKSLQGILLKATDPNEKEKLRGLIKYASNSKYNDTFGNYASPGSKEILYSAKMNTMLRSTLPKRELFNLMLAELQIFAEQSKHILDKEITPDSLKIQMENEYSRLTEEDISVLIGMSIASRFQLEELSKNPLYSKATLLQKQMEAPDLASWQAYFGFLGNNPLYTSTHTYFPYSHVLRPADATELLGCIASYDSLRNRYPGALFIKQARLRFISFYCDSFPELRPRLYGMLLEGLIDLADRDQNMETASDEYCGYITINRENNPYRSYTLGEILILFTEQAETAELKRLKQLLAAKAKARPYQKNLQNLNASLN